MAKYEYADKDTGALVTARQVTEDTLEDVAWWCGGAPLLREDEPDKYPNGRTVLEFATSGGILTADVGYWVINDRGLWFTLSDDEFQARYETPA